MDKLVLSTQKWVNKNYSGKQGYKKITEDGITGWSTMKALIQALQIELGITADGDFGPTTSSYFKEISINNSSNKNINYILQGGLYCKGYEAGAFDGVFSEKTQKAIKTLQSDAGISQTGSVNSSLMKAILTMDAFKLLNYGDYHGDSNIRKIQQSLNAKYSSNASFAKKIGLVPCDGIYARTTNKALIFALQIEEGVSLVDGVWGTKTKELAPTLSLGSTKKNFIYILQYALYCNGFNPNGFDGGYGNGVKKAVSDFQSFSGLDSDGIAGKQTWASLLVSTGDPNRKGTMCDCSTTITAAKAQTLRNNGYKSVGRYLTGKFKMTSSELNTIFSAGLRVYPIFETGGYKLSYFNAVQGNKDAKSAISAASSFGFEAGTIIYFTVDFDALDQDVTSSILPYFREISAVFKRTKTKYKIGIYAPRNVCSRVSLAGYSCSSFVCDMSSGFSGNLGYSLPKDWAIDQISTITIGSGNGQIEIDNNISSGRDMGVSRVTLGNDAAGISDPNTELIERIVVSGSEYDAALEVGGVGIYGRRFKYNFIEPAINELRRFKKEYPYDTVTWLISQTDYSKEDIENFKDTARRLEVDIKFFNSATEFENYINSNRDERKIGSLTIFSHGVPGGVEFGYHQSNQAYLSFNIYHLSKIKVSSFKSNTHTDLYSCNGAKPVEESCNDCGLLKDVYGKNFAEEWYKNGFGSIKAAYGKTNYAVIFGELDNEDDIKKHVNARSYKGYCEEGAVNYPRPTAEGAKWVNYPK